MSLIAKDLYKSFKKRTVVSGVNLQVEKGQIVGLLGPNGAGKSTTFYMMVGLIKADSGSVLLWDQDISRTPMYERCAKGIGYLPQEPSVFRKMTVYDNIMAALEFRDLNRTARKERAQELIEQFRLTHVAKSHGYALSGGERRRVEIARCLAGEPDFIMLDEPFAGIDPISVADIQQMIFALKQMEIGVLITDHNVRDTLKITDHAYIITDGKVLTEGAPQEVVNHEEVIEKYLGREFTL
jgi:lipopolysaccharide export system ATP-binding protein